MRQQAWCVSDAEMLWFLRLPLQFAFLLNRFPGLFFVLANFLFRGRPTGTAATVNQYASNHQSGYEKAT